MTWNNLSEMGYWVFPTKNRQKFPTQFGGRKWDTFIKDGEHELAHAYLSREAGTGAALCPQAGDPIPLLILDLDAYGREFDDVWAKISPDCPPDDGVCVVASPSGGYHVWFRLPPDIIAARLPATIDFGDGVAGEIRVSSKTCRLIMLPDSLATNKNGKAAHYRVIAGGGPDGLDPKLLSYPPETLAARLVARPNQGKRTEIGGKPTEAIHFIALLELLDVVPEGGRNNAVAQIGQVLGRLHPGKSPDPELVAAAWEKLEGKLGDFKQTEFRVSMNSGWVTGSRNGAREEPDRHRHQG